MFKKLFYLSLFVLFIQCNAKNPPGQVQIMVNLGESCAVVISAPILMNFIPFEASERLIGTGSNAYYLGQLSVYMFNNTSQPNHVLSLTSTTFDAGLDQYVAINGSTELPIGIKKNFDPSGTTTPFEYISASSSGVTIRSSSSIIDETRTFFFYVLENSANVFIDGDYTASFTLTFSSV